MKISEMIRMAQTPDTEVEMGRKVEMEHKSTIEYLRKNPNAPLEKVVEMIARDHLKEIPDYYTRLKKMEDEGKAARKARAAQSDEDCPEGYRWCPIQKKCIPGGRPGRGLGRGKGFGPMQGQDDTRTKLVEFFKANPNPDDDQVHDFAEELGMEPDDLETEIYALLSELLK
jgi:hypothetical protein